MERTYADTAHFAGIEYRFAEVVPPLGPGEGVVICAPVSAPDRRLYLPSSQWPEGTDAQGDPTVTATSPTAKKLALFKRLFRGRVDVYAHGYHNRKTGRVGYTPACAHEWETPLCQKPHVRCGACEHREFRPLDDGVLLRHFRGERSDGTDVVGLYPMVDESFTHVLVADFDKGEWRREVASYRAVCEEQGLCVAVERSRSGNGAHAWLFFDEAVEASEARSLGAALLTLAMGRGEFSDFSAYDRMFPSQDTVDKEGLGNLIALPFQGAARREGNTVFVDAAFEPYADQWAYLSSVEPVTKNDVEHITKLVRGGPLGYLVREPDSADATAVDSESGGRPWARRRKRVLSKRDFPSCVHITKANMLFVEKAGMSGAARDAVRRLAAFANPDFYRAQSMRLSTYGIRRIVYLGEEHDDCIALPRGCEEPLLGMVADAGCDWYVDDQRNAVSGRLKISFIGELRPEQQDAVDAVTRYETGVLSAPTAFGKTVAAAAIIGRHKVKTLVVVPSVALLDQWRSGLEKFLVIEEQPEELLTKTGRKSRKKRPVIGRIGGGKNEPSGIVDVALFQSLLTAGDVVGEKVAKELVSTYDLVICDECHHVPAVSFKTVLHDVRARYVYGLSATPKRKDGLTPMIFMLCGPLRFAMSARKQAEQQAFKRYLVPRFTSVRLDEEAEPGPGQYARLLEQVSFHEGRNCLIVDDVCAALDNGRTPLVLTRLKAHAQLLVDLLRERGRKAILLVGSDTPADKLTRLEEARSLKAEDSCALVATGSYLGEGFDLPRLDALFLAAPVSWEGLLAQYTGRLHRDAEGKKDVLVYDYIDASVPLFDKMYRKRLKGYAGLGYTVSPDYAAGEATPCIVEGDAVFEGLLADVEACGCSLALGASGWMAKRAEALAGEVRKAVARSVAVTVYVGVPERRRTSMAAAAASLERAGCDVRWVEGACGDFAVLDGRLVWYASGPLLGTPRTGECGMRIHNAEVAHELVERAERLAVVG